MAKTRARNQERESRWREVISRQERSGLSVRAFCRREGIHESGFHYWKRSLRQRDDDLQSSARSRKRSSKTPALLPVTIATGSAALAPVEVLLATGVTLRVSAGCDGNTLRTVLDALESS